MACRSIPSKKLVNSRKGQPKCRQPSVQLQNKKKQHFDVAVYKIEVKKKNSFPPFLLKLRPTYFPHLVFLWLLSSWNRTVCVAYGSRDLGCPKITPSVKCLAPEAFSGAKLQVFMENGQKNEID